MTQNQILTTEQKIDVIYNEVLNGNKVLDFLNVISVVLGFYNTMLNRKQIDNNAIMRELEKQDNVYFEKIISLLNELKGDNNGYEQCNDETNDGR